ncbi:MAG: hypothetical protein LAO06_03285 [Acidobacteriia bacterium]|nr:hypothetical protein [Terriglobia bacterium]
MRLFRALSCALILAVLAAAVTSSAQTGSSPGSSQQQPGQAPENPIQEATQPTSLSQQQQQQPQRQAEAARENRPTFDVGGAGAGQQDQALGEVRLMTRYSDINAGSPEGKARSFHNQGENDLAEFNYFLDRNLFSTGHRFQFLTMFRGTDDSSIDPERNSIQKGFVRIYGPRDEYIFGDALVNYSRLTFNQNIKGVSASWKLGKKWKMSATGGVFIDRWGSLFKDQPMNQPGFAIDPNTKAFLIDPVTGARIPTITGCQPPVYPTPSNFVQSNDPQCGRPFAAAVSGARLEYAFIRDSVIGFNFSSSNDLVDSRAPLAVGAPAPFPSPQPATNQVGSIDFKYQTRGLRMDGEFAYSATNYDRRLQPCAGAPTVAPPSGHAIFPCDSRMPNAGLGVQDDWGARFEAAYRYKKLNFRASYVRYQPNFAAINARQISDLQDFLFRVSMDALPWLTVDGTARRNNNNLKNQQAFQTTIWGPEGRLIFHDLSFYRRASLEVGYRHRMIDGSTNAIPLQFDVTTNQFVATPITGCSFSPALTGPMVCIDRSLRQPYVELTAPISTTFLTVGYERRQSLDRLKVGQSNNTDRYYFGFRGIYDFGGWHLSPTIRYELERQNHRNDLDTFLGLPSNQVQYLNPLQFLYLDHDTNRLGTATVYVEAPRWFILEAGFRDTSATITVPATLTVPCSAATTPPCVAGQTTISQVVNGASGYSRPSFRVALTYKLMNDENKVLIFSFERNNNFYFGPPTSTDPVGFPPGGALSPLNFDERIAGVTFVYKFGKRGR